MQAHVLAHFIDSGGPTPALPFLCLTVSGGHTQIVRVNKPFEMILLGQTTDDAAGEAFDKIAKMLGLPYPGGPLIDHHAAKGDPYRFTFPEVGVAKRCILYRKKHGGSLRQCAGAYCTDFNEEIQTSS
jgi:N6-L-threonylcarbamoyladenine synthase